MRAPPASNRPMIGARAFMAMSWIFTIFCACVSDSEPPKTVKSLANTNTVRPLTVPQPVTTPSPGIFCCWSMPKSTQRCSTNMSNSSNEPLSIRSSMRSRAVSLPRLCCVSMRALPPPSRAWSRRISSFSRISFIAAAPRDPARRSGRFCLKHFRQKGNSACPGRCGIDVLGPGGRKGADGRAWASGAAPSCEQPCLPMPTGRCCGLPHCGCGLFRSGGEQIEHPRGGLHFGEPRGAALAREFILAPPLHVPVLVHMGGRPGGGRRKRAGRERERDQRRAGERRERVHGTEPPRLGRDGAARRRDRLRGLRDELHALRHHEGRTEALACEGKNRIPVLRLARRQRVRRRGPIADEIRAEIFLDLGDDRRLGCRNAVDDGVGEPRQRHPG